MHVQTTTTTSPESVVEVARAVAAEVDGRGEEIERARTLPADLVARFRDTGLFSMALPAVFGGLECPPLTVVEVIEEMSRADPSAGWTLLIGQGAGFLAWLEPAAAADLVAVHPRPIVASSMAPAGRGEETGDGYRLSGRWPFTSGCAHSDLLMAGFVATRDGVPVTTAQGAPAQRMAFVPAGETDIVDTWRVAGLRGTGSHDVVVRGTVVPRELTADPFFEQAKQPGPLYGASMFSFLMTMMAGFPLGVARRALDEFHAAAHARTRQPAGTSMAEEPVTQAAILRCESAVRAARALVVDAIGLVTEAVASGNGAPPPVRARLAGAVVHAMTTAREVVETAFHSCGARSLYAGHPLQRCFRDVHAASQHVAFGQEAVKRLGRIELGLPTPTFLV
ncbi:acyl-CoA dehydrogenase family protein [Micromonospora carbonacea]|uniref:Acyl-CoA dehydrogenase family protein n=1 Tax=Micromonospora carbonacea TaxID=47853 RepID=A0A7H8XL20_9ACTN|nr:acyl-CoA dehydrogenase family protein [Micromonospora carbonacea]MBB5825932.1 alkylation response protein AidB-like acyl-CoA dehydrogenase [Micromonospora carbonacea]QLD25524.1 acyl-CoA dehydrogenase family protein [Micromonospora carbonacea]